MLHMYPFRKKNIKKNTTIIAACIHIHRKLYNVMNLSNRSETVKSIESRLVDESSRLFESGIVREPRKTIRLISQRD